LSWYCPCRGLSIPSFVREWATKDTADEVPVGRVALYDHSDANDPCAGERQFVEPQ